MKVISLLSGGIDSPVATYMMMKKAEVIVAHFRHRNESTKKIEDLLEVLKKYGKLKAYFLPFDYINSEIIPISDPKFRMIMYRLAMLKVAEKLAEKEGAHALVTGDSLGQVASQTVDNLYVVYKRIKLPILTPLIGFNKEETVEIARKINTYEISIRPYAECCSFMIAKHPRTKAKDEEIKEIEEKIDWEYIISKTIEEAELKHL